jgi:hypothetical protein
MELCSIEDAFPNIEMTKEGGSGPPFVGCKDSKASREERRAARKKAKRCKAIAPGPATYLEAFQSEVATEPDPDRPAVKRMGSVEAFQASVDPATLLVPIAKQAPKIPVLPKASCLYSDPGYPSYFGKGEEEDLEEGFASYSAGSSGPGGDDSSYRLEPDFLKSFQLQGAQKAANSSLPAPNLNDSWKPLTPGAASYTAFYEGEEPVGPGKADQEWALSFLETTAPTAPVKQRVARPVEQPTIQQRFGEEKKIREIDGASKVVPAGGNPKEDKDLLLARIDALMGRIEMLEQKKTQDTQKELLMFVGGGLALLLSFQLVSSK